MSNNTEPGRWEDHHYDLYDALPDLFRQALQQASSDMNCGPVHLYIKAYGPRHALTVVCRQLADMRRDLILKHYGPQHPQAQY